MASNMEIFNRALELAATNASDIKAQNIKDGLEDTEIEIGTTEFFPMFEFSNISKEITQEVGSGELVAYDSAPDEGFQITNDTQENIQVDGILAERLVTIITPVIIALIFLMLGLLCCCIQRRYKKRRNQSLYIKTMGSISPWKQTNTN